MSDFRICGTARLAMAKLALEADYRRGLRQLAQGKHDEARATLAALEWDERAQPPLCEVEIARAMLLPPAEAAAVREQHRAAVDAREQQLRHWVKSYTEKNDRMWLAREKMQLANLLHVRGDDAGAEPLYRSAITLIEELWGPGHLEVASYLEDLATMLWHCGRAGEAEAAVARAEKIRTSPRPERGAP